MPGDNLFEQDDPADAKARVDALLSMVPTSHPMKRAFAAGLLLAEAATQRISLHALHDSSDPGTDPLPENVVDAFGYIEWLADYVFKGEPARIDLINWDARGAIIGWFIGNDGKPDQTHSCPSAVLDLARALILFADHAPEWRDLLRAQANELEGLRRLSIERLGPTWEEKVKNQGLWSRLTRPKDEAVFAWADGYFIKGSTFVRNRPFDSPHDPK